ncbi:MAG: extracellular solute-binding protein [Jannaschia sp.]
MTKRPRNMPRARTGRARLAAAISVVGLFAGAAQVAAQDIRVWSGYPELEPFYLHVAEGMKADHPDLNVTVEAINLRDHERRVALGLTSGEAAEVIEMASALAPRYLENELFNAAPDAVATFVSDPANYGEFFRDGASFGGSVYGVPMFRGQSALYYNTDMLAAAGLDGPPATMADYDTYAAALTQRGDGSDPTVSGWSLRFSGGGAGITEKFTINMFQHGGTFLEESEDGKWRAAFADEAGRKTLQQYLNALYGDETVTVSMPADAEAFEREQTAMFIRESWVIGDIAAKSPDLAYATATLPEGSIVSQVNLYITGEGDAEQAAWDFALAAQEPENQLWLLDNVGWLPNRLGLDFSDIVARKPAFEAFVNLPEDYGFFTNPAVGPVEEIMARFAAQLERAFADPSLLGDDAAIDAFLEGAAEEINGILARDDLLADET